MAEGASQGGREAGAGTRLAAELAELSLRIGLVTRALVALQREGHVPAHASCGGEEGVVAAAGLALAEGDWFFPAARDALGMLGRGVALRDVFAHALGRGGPAAGRAPVEAHPSRAARVVPPGGLLGAHLPHATGFAWAARTRGEAVAVLTTLERRMVPTGHFHNAVNFAGVFRAPIVFLCREDGRGEAGEPGEPGAAARGVAYGVPSVAVDGADPIAVHAALADALARARSGGGPAIVEVRTTPTTDDAPAAEAALAALAPAAGLEGAGAGALRTRLEAEVAAARDAALAIAPPAPTELVAHVFATPPAHLAAQRESLAAHARPTPQETSAGGATR